MHRTFNKVLLLLVIAFGGHELMAMSPEDMSDFVHTRKEIVHTEFDEITRSVRQKCVEEAGPFDAIKERARFFLHPGVLPDVASLNFAGKTFQDMLYLASLLYYQRVLIEQNAKTEAYVKAHSQEKGMSPAIASAMTGVMGHIARVYGQDPAYKHSRKLYDEIITKYLYIEQLLTPEFRGYLYPLFAFIDAENYEKIAILDVTFKKDADIQRQPLLEAPRLVIAAWCAMYAEQLDVFYNAVLTRLNELSTHKRKGVRALVFDAPKEGSSLKNCGSLLKPITVKAVPDQQELFDYTYDSEELDDEDVIAHDSKHKGTQKQVFVEEELVDEAPTVADDGACGLTDEELAQRFLTIRVDDKVVAKTDSSLCSVGSSREKLSPPVPGFPSILSYADRVCHWHRDGIENRAQKFWTMIQHRIPFILERDYGCFARPGVYRKSATRADRTFCFDGWIEVFNRSVRIPGTFELTVAPDERIYHRFFRIDKKRGAAVPLLPDGPVQEVRFARMGLSATYLITETDEYVCIAEKNDPYGVRYVIRKKLK